MNDAQIITHNSINGLIQIIDNTGKILMNMGLTGREAVVMIHESLKDFMVQYEKSMEATWPSQ